MTDKTPDSSEKKLPETPETDDEDFVFPGDENIAIPVKFNLDQYDIPEDDESPMVYERSQVPETPETDDDLGEEEEQEEETDDVETKSPGPADIDPSMYEDEQEEDDDDDSEEDDDNLRKL